MRPLSDPRRKRPAWLPLAELRAPLELAGTLAAFPLLAAQPRGDGHSVITLPGWLGDDTSTLTLRVFLRMLGYRARGWGLGRNRGIDAAALDTATAATRQEFEQSGEPVSLIGWSLGGVYAREIARRVPDQVRCVISLGSPIQRDPRTRRAPPVPSTAIFSPSDAIVPPHWAHESKGPRSESLEISASHLGLGHHPLVLHAIADRLRQQPESWRPFQAKGLRRYFYRGDS